VTIKGNSMIVPMKKIHVIVQTKDIVPALEDLRGLGVLHVEHQEELSGYQLEERRDEVAVLQQALNVFERLGRQADGPQIKVPDWTDSVGDVLKLWAEIEHDKETIAQRAVEIRGWQPWGNFDPKDIQGLAARGIYVQLCEMPAKKMIEFPAGVIVEDVFTAANVRRCLAVSRAKVVLPVQTVALPSLSLREMEALQARDQAKVKQAQERIARLRRYEDAFKEILVERENVLRFEEVQKGMREEEDLGLLKGFCPIHSCGVLQAKAKREHWGLLMEDPAMEDRVPTLLRNPKGVAIVNPVFDFMSIIPGYREADVSFCFLFFFSMFFGILIGDAGYGLMFFLTTFFLQQKVRDKVPDQAVFYLIYVLSGCAIIWGLLTGTFFGVSLFGQYVKPMVPWLMNEDNVKLLCFIIGAVHLTIAHVWRGWRKWPSLLFLSDVGWIMIVWAAFFYAQQFILDKPIPAFVNPMGFAAFGIIVVFGQSLQDILKDVVGFTIGIMLTVLSIVSTLIDVISYIRLFAVGTAGVTLAEAFNQMALGVGFHNFLLGVGAVFILLIGHSLNIILGMLAIMVHGLRLNILEFSGHLSLEWSGVKYNPFQREAAGKNLI
jgi:V/A-type H+-transporting ATPase subunit I